ncbi:MAG: precorrin-6A reductase [Desulfuromonadaceae bacterium]|nr:precorrin-6A reductase [Desulfuromonadaceae bacterium]
MSDAAHILLLGGTSETAPLAVKLATAGYQVLVSTATDAALAVGDHPAIRRRCGRLDRDQLAALIDWERMAAVIDATHPYARDVHQAARDAAAHSQRPYLRYQRRALVEASGDVVTARDHDEAAQLACAAGRPVLLTTGSRHLAPYVAAAQHHDIAVCARMLNHPEAVAACEQAGLADTGRIFGRGPFSLEQNRALIRHYNIGVLVTKDSGRAGGVAEKLAAARLEQCRVIVVQRPDETSDNTFDDMDRLVTALQQYCPAPTVSKTGEMK